MSRKKKILILMLILIVVYFITIEQWIFVGMFTITVIVALVVRTKPNIGRNRYSGGRHDDDELDYDDKDEDELDYDDYGTR